MNRSLPWLRLLRSCLPVPFALALGMWLTQSSPALCDRVILTPTGTALAQNTQSGELLQMFDPTQETALWANAGLSRLEIEGAYFHQPGRDAVSLSAETPLLPETFATPAVALGVRDILNSTHDLRDLGYGGRAYYLAATKTYPATQASVFFHNISLSGGLGAGSLRGLFGSVTGQMPLGLQASFEYDGTRANTQVALSLSRISRLEYTRIGHDGFVGFELNSPVSF